MLCKEVVQFSQHHVLKRLPFPCCMFLALLSSINRPCRCEFVSVTAHTLDHHRASIPALKAGVKWEEPVTAVYLPSWRHPIRGLFWRFTCASPKDGLTLPCPDSSSLDLVW